MTRALASALIVTALLAGAAPLAGCSTVAGAGQDVAAGGRAVTQGAQGVKRRL